MDGTPLHLAYDPEADLLRVGTEAKVVQKLLEQEMQQRLQRVGGHLRERLTLSQHADRLWELCEFLASVDTKFSQLRLRLVETNDYVILTERP